MAGLYQYGGKLTIEQEIAAAEEAKEEAKRRVQARRTQLNKLRAERKRAKELQEYETRLLHQIRELTGERQLPEPVYGGRRGLEAATREMAEYNRTRDSRKRPALEAA